MAVYNTSNASISVGGTTLTGLVDANITLTMETVDVSEIGAQDRTFIGGIRSGSASLNLFYDQNNVQIGALEAAVKSGATVALVFTLHSGATYTVNCMVESFNPSIAVSDVVKAAVNLKFIGAVTIA